MGNLKPGDMHGKLAMLKTEKVAEDVAKTSLKSLGTKETVQLTKGGNRGPGKHYKGIYN